MKQNHYRAPIKRPLVACVALLGMDKVKYAHVCKDAPKAFKTALPDIVWDWLFIVCSVVAVFCFCCAAYGIMFLFSI